MTIDNIIYIFVCFFALLILSIYLIAIYKDDKKRKKDNDNKFCELMKKLDDIERWLNNGQ